MEQLYSPEELAQYLSVSTQTLLRWRNDGKGPKFSYLAPKLIRYTSKDVQDWIEQNTCKSLADAKQLQEVC